MSVPVVTAAQMREMDRVTIEEIGVPGVVLMEVAGRGTADVVEAFARSSHRIAGLSGWRVAILCGTGNNGGDGYVVARHLHLRGAEVRVLVVGARERITGDSLVNLAAAEKLAVDFEWLDADVDVDPNLAERLADYDCVVDALLGTGLSSAVRGHHGEVIRALNAAHTLTVAVDIPSGLSSDTGHPQGVAVEADATVTFGHPKIGVVTHPGVEYTGDLHIVDIGIPPTLAVQHDVRCHLLEERDVVGLLPTRMLGGHKGTYGHLLVVAGSLGKTGAAVLCARGAARVGAGLVTVAVPTDGLPGVVAQSLETMTETYGPSSVDLDPQEVTARLVAMTRGKQALALGPGIPTGEAMLEVLRELLPDATVPVLLDADGLNVAARKPELLNQVSTPLVLTPHPGEMARLLGVSIDEVQANRLVTAREAASRFGAFVALKGTRTVVVAPDGEAFINPTGNPGMGSGGMGDVLTGLIGGLLVQGVAPFSALKLAVFLHGLAGDVAARDLGLHALLAGDLLDRVGGLLVDWEGRLLSPE